MPALILGVWAIASYKKCVRHSHMLGVAGMAQDLRAQSDRLCKSWVAQQVDHVINYNKKAFQVHAEQVCACHVDFC